MQEFLAKNQYFGYQNIRGLKKQWSLLIKLMFQHDTIQGETMNYKTILICINIYKASFHAVEVYDIYKCRLSYQTISRLAIIIV